METSVGTQQSVLKRQRVKMKTSIRLLLDSVEDVNKCQGPPPDLSVGL